MDIAPTVLSILNTSSKLTSDGKSLPIRECYTLHVSDAPASLKLWQRETQLANDSAEKCRTDSTASRRARENGDAGKRGRDDGSSGMAAIRGNREKILGVMLILAINLARIAIIVRI